MGSWKNVEVEITDELVVVTMRKDGNWGRSSSGKSILVATTSGYVEVEPGLQLGLNMVRPTKFKG